MAFQFEWYDPLLFIANPIIGTQAILAREGARAGGAMGQGGVLNFKPGGFWDPGKPITNMQPPRTPKPPPNVGPYNPMMPMGAPQPDMRGLNFSSPMMPIRSFGNNNSERLLRQLQAQRMSMMGGGF